MPISADVTPARRVFATDGYSNAAFCDGHAESLSACYTNNSDGAANVAPGTGFLSTSNSLYDLQ